MIRAISDLCSDGRSICYGIVQPGRHVEGGLPILRVANLRGDRIDTSDVMRVDPEIEQKYKRSRIRENDVLVSLVGSMGQVAIAGPEVEGWNVARAVGIIPATDRHHAEWIRYSLQSREAQQFIVDHANTTVQATFNLRDLSRLPIPFPDESTRKRILSILTALDDKIELNRRMSVTLEEMARALYRSWFVDFDPVYARALGQPPAHMDPTTAALFPDSFGPDGLPTGWKWECFDNHYSVLETGKRPKGGVSSISGGVPSIGAESIKNVGYYDFAKTKFVPRDFFLAMRKGHLEEGDILIYKDGGKPGELRPAVTYVSKGFPYPEACINEHVFRVRLSEEVGQHFGFLAISSDHCMNQMRELATGVAQPGLNQSAMKALSLLMPDNMALVRHFEEIVTPLLDGCNERARESQTLAALRDTLLPRLMSGDLRIREAEKQVEEVI